MTLTLKRVWDDVPQKEKMEMIHAHLNTGIPLETLIYFTETYLARVIFDGSTELFGVDAQGAESLIEDQAGIDKGWICYAVEDMS